METETDSEKRITGGTIHTVASGVLVSGNFDMMLNGWTSSPIYTKHCYKSPARTLARLIDSKYGRVIDPPQILVH